VPYSDFKMTFIRGDEVLDTQTIRQLMGSESAGLSLTEQASLSKVDQVDVPC
jgi:hypothetical protein